MNGYEFIGYLETPNEEYFMGVATIRFMRRIVIRYKIIKNKDDTGYFVSEPSYRIVGDGKPEYLKAIIVDSQIENDELKRYIRNCVNQAMNPNNQQQQQQETQQPPQQQSQQECDLHQQPPQQQQQVQQAPQQSQPQQQYGQPDLNSCPF